MKVLISDYKKSMMPDHSPEINVFKKGFGEDVEIEIYPYEDSKKDEFMDKISDADILLTAFITIDKEILDAAKNLKFIALNSTGYDKVDLEEANKRKIGVSPVGEYCTWDVSESAVAFAFALNKGLKHYDLEINKEHKWDFSSFEAVPRIEESTVGIFGFGKIGQCTAKKFSGISKKIIANDISEKTKIAEKIGVKLASPDEIFEKSDIIINHMNYNKTNHEFFNKETFSKMKKHPIFINLARGLSVNHKDLEEALDNGLIRGAGLDVLESEFPDLEKEPLLGRDNVIITPHSSFYSKDSLYSLSTIPCENAVFFINGEYEKVFKLVNKDIFVR